MSGVSGYNALSVRKGNVAESSLVTRGVRKLVFVHEFTAAGESSLSFSDLTVPSSMSGNGFSQPSANEIMSANLRFYRDNVRVFSSVNGELLDYLTYTISNNGISFISPYVSSIGEIIKVSFDQNVQTGMPIVDAQPLTSTGTLLGGTSDYNVGQAFKINMYPSHQIGEVMVYKNGVLQMRNVNNETAGTGADGNYEEIHATGGFGTLIRFNPQDVDSSDMAIMVVSTNLLVEKPEVSMMQVIERLGGQIDNMIPTLADVAGVDENEFQSTPNHIDLKSFGEKVQDNKALLDAIGELEIPEFPSQDIYINQAQSSLLSLNGIRFDLSTANIITSGYSSLLSYTDNGTRTIYTALENIDVTFSASGYMTANWNSMFRVIISDGREIWGGSMAADGTNNNVHYEDVGCSFKLEEGDTFYCMAGVNLHNNSEEYVNQILVRSELKKIKNLI